MSGFEKPNYTQAPNAFFDELLPQIDSMAELKVTLVVIRQTFGYHRAEDELSISRLVELTGLSRPSVVDGVKRGLKRGTITRRALDPEAKQDRYVYRARVVKNLNQSEEAASKDTEPVASKESLPTKEREKESNDTSNDVSAAAKATPAPKAIKPGQFGFARFRSIETEAKAKGWKPDPLPESRAKEYASFYGRAFEEGEEAEHLDLAVWWLFAKASGQIEHEPQAWAYFGTATRAVEAGWRPRASLRAVPNPEAEKEREELDREWAEILSGVN